MGISKDQALKAAQFVRTAEVRNTKVLDASNTSETIFLYTAANSISFQASDTFEGTVDVSLNGKDFVNAGSITAGNAISKYDTTHVASVKVTRTSGSGIVTIVAK